MFSIKTKASLGIFAGAWGLLLFSCAGIQKSVLVPPDPRLTGVSCIAVLPFDNISGRPEAGRIISDLLATELYASRRFNLMEWEEVETSLQSAGMTFPASLDSDTARNLAQSLGVQAALIGTISDFAYASTLLEVRAGLPSIAFTARLIDAQTGNPLWASALSLSSTEMMEPRRESLNFLAQTAARDMARSLTEGNYQPVDAKNVCWAKAAGMPAGRPAPAPMPAVAPAQPAAPVAPAAPPKPKVKPKLAVFNASGVAGLEENVGLILLMKNWDVATLAKYPYEKTFDSTIIYYRSGYDAEAKSVESDIPGPQQLVQTEKMAEDVHITILVGKDQIGR